MKKCQLCGERSSDDVATCPNDGEASWAASDVVVPVGAKTLDIVHPDVDTDAPKRKARR